MLIKEIELFLSLLLKKEKQNKTKDIIDMLPTFFLTTYHIIEHFLSNTINIDTKHYKL